MKLHINEKKILLLFDSMKNPWRLNIEYVTWLQKGVYAYFPLIIYFEMIFDYVIDFENNWIFVNYFCIVSMLISSGNLSGAGAPIPRF